MRFAWADEHLTPDARRMLVQLRERLALSRDEAAAIEDDLLGGSSS